MCVCFVPSPSFLKASVNMFFILFIIYYFFPFSRRASPSGRLRTAQFLGWQTCLLPEALRCSRPFPCQRTGNCRMSSTQAPPYTGVGSSLMRSLCLLFLFIFSCFSTVHCFSCMVFALILFSKFLLAIRAYLRFRTATTSHE